MYEPPTVEHITRVYVKIRDRRRELAKQDQELEEQLETLAQQLLAICKEQGAETIRTQFGTVSRRVSKRFWTSDWESLYGFIKEHDAMSLLQQRIHTSNMAQFLEENPDLHPPGLNADVSQTIVVVKR